MDQIKQILFNRITTRLKTTFIGAIDIIDSKFGEKLTDEEFNQLRKMILDLGNNQIRGMQEELGYYTVGLIDKRFQIEEKNGGNIVQGSRFKGCGKCSQNHCDKPGNSFGE
jgi:hypothetical protein